MTQEYGQQQSRDQGQEEDTGSEKPDGRSIAEWTTLGISILVLLTIVGLVTYVYVSGGNQPTTIDAEAKVGEIRQEGSSYYVPVEVTNVGDQTAESVEIEGELDTGSGMPQTASFTVQFLAGGEKVRGTLVFDSDPRLGQLTVGAVSYNQP